MSPRRLLVALFASALMLPVSCSLVTLPLTRALAKADGRDLRAGEIPHLPPFVAVAEPGADATVLVVPLADLDALTAKSPALTPWLPTPEGDEGSGDDRTLWRPVASTPTRREMQLTRVTENYTHTFRYAVTPDGTITPLHSDLFAMGHLFTAIPFGIAVAFGLRWLALRARRRLAAKPPPR